MLGNTYDNQVCSIARTLELIGERWTILIVRDAFLGIRRFEDFQRSLGVSRGILADRLDRLVEAGHLHRRPYPERPEPRSYPLSSKGGGPLPALLAAAQRR